MKYQILILVALISSVLLSGCITQADNPNNRTLLSYQIINVKTVYHEGFLGGDCYYTVVYYNTPQGIRDSIVKPCSIGERPQIHIIEDKNESLLLYHDTIDIITDVYVTEETLKNNIW